MNVNLYAAEPQQARLRGGIQGHAGKWLLEASSSPPPPSLQDPPLSREENGLSWEENRGRANSYTSPNSCPSPPPQCKVLIIEPKSIFIFLTMVIMFMRG